jgi:hypothetical protein
MRIYGCFAVMSVTTKTENRFKPKKKQVSSGEVILLLLLLLLLPLLGN